MAKTAQTLGHVLYRDIPGKNDEIVNYYPIAPKLEMDLFN